MCILLIIFVKLVQWRNNHLKQGMWQLIFLKVKWNESSFDYVFHYDMIFLKNGFKEKMKKCSFFVMGY
jgi:hypothetical protein